MRRALFQTAVLGSFLALTAATALAGYLAPLSTETSGTLHWSVDQGVEMGRPSRIEVEADLSDRTVTGIRVSGRSVLVSHGEMEIPGVV